MSLQINGHQTLAKTRLHESCAVVFESHVVGLLRWNVRTWIVRVMFAPNVFFQATFFVVVSFHTRILLLKIDQKCRNKIDTKWCGCVMSIFGVQYFDEDTQDGSFGRRKFEEV